MHHALVPLDPDGLQCGDRRGLPRTGRNRQGDDGPEALFEAKCRIGRWALRRQLEIGGIGGLCGECHELGIVQELVRIGQIALERERDAAAKGDPDGRGPGDGFGGPEDLRGWVCVGGCRDQVGSAGEGDIGRNLGGAGDDAAGNREEFAAGPGDQGVAGMSEGLEKCERGGWKVGIERRGADAVEVESRERDGGGGDARGESGIDGGGRGGSPAGSEHREGYGCYGCGGAGADHHVL